MKRTFWFLLAILALPGLAAGMPPSGTPVKPGKLLKILDDELKRNLAVLKKEPVPPYFVAYSVKDVTGSRIRASFGALEADEEQRGRMLSVEVRVGDYRLDNTHAIRGSGWEPGFSTTTARLPIEDDEAAIRETLWRETDRAFKDAVERIAKVRTNREVKVSEEDPSDDFSRETAEKSTGEPASLVLDRAAWRGRVKAWSTRFLDDPRILSGAANLFATAEQRWFVSSEGAAVYSGATLVRLMIEASTKADDGMMLPLHLSYASMTPEGLPADDRIQADVKDLMEEARPRILAKVAGMGRK